MCRADAVVVHDNFSRQRQVLIEANGSGYIDCAGDVAGGKDGRQTEIDNRQPVSSGDPFPQIRNGSADGGLRQQSGQGGARAEEIVAMAWHIFIEVAAQIDSLRWRR